jgi:hypothetical protein
MPIYNDMRQPKFSKSRANRVPILALALLAVSSCVNSTGGRDDQDRIAGVYVLQSVDGVAVPAPIAPQQGCNRTVRDGKFSISVGGADSRPMYDWSIAIPADCQPVPSGVYEGGDDVGNWGFKNSNQLLFASMMGRGSYTAALEETPGNPPSVTIANSGNSYRFVRVMRWDDPRGLVFVNVVDQTGVPVPGVVLVFTDVNGFAMGGTTQESGQVLSERVVGECKISITPPAGYEVPTSQPNPVSVSIVEGSPVHITVTLTKL